VPVVTTLHGRLDLPELQPFYRHFKDVPLVSISEAQRRPVWWANFLGTVYHGIELDQFTFRPRADGYLAYLGRISPEKGLDAAVRIARQAGLPLKIAARPPLPHTHDPNVQADWAYFEQVIQPLLEYDQVEFVGELAGAAKDRFLGGAVALLFPICWPELFGLVMAEALACGTPVLALDHGSVPEVVQDGVTGFVRDDEDELVEAVSRIGELSRYACRAEAERRFSPAAMTDAYERLYGLLTPPSQVPVPIGRARPTVGRLVDSQPRVSSAKRSEMRGLQAEEDPHVVVSLDT
jgi:glycosyltransferase involved in cell wall biosynthesis